MSMICHGDVSHAGEHLQVLDYRMFANDRGAAPHAMIGTA